MSARAKYDRDAITRAFQFHEVEGQHADPAIVFHGLDGQGRWRVRLGDEIVVLSAREAWLVALALASGRSAGRRVEREVRTS